MRSGGGRRFGFDHDGVICPVNQHALLSRCSHQGHTRHMNFHHERNSSSATVTNLHGISSTNSHTQLEGVIAETSDLSSSPSRSSAETNEAPVLASSVHQSQDPGKMVHGIAQVLFRSTSRRFQAGDSLTFVELFFNCPIKNLEPFDARKGTT